jgi:hypothetical protein
MVSGQTAKEIKTTANTMLSANQPNGIITAICHPLNFLSGDPGKGGGCLRER